MSILFVFLLDTPPKTELDFTLTFTFSGKKISITTSGRGPSAAFRFKFMDANNNVLKGLKVENDEVTNVETEYINYQAGECIVTVPNGATYIEYYCNFGDANICDIKVID